MELFPGLAPVSPSPCPPANPLDKQPVEQPARNPDAPPSTRPIIRALEPHLINQIAAGEVVERPAAALKELLENALDAGASRLDVSWRQGGQSLLCVSDNGCAMSPEEMELALNRHTTSKLPTGDLWSISSFGFRGEALAAIASTARVTMISRPNQAGHGWQIQVESGKIVDQRPTPAAPGTTIEVRDLFYSTPARLKFLRSTAVEQAALVDVVDRMALIFPDVTLTVTSDGRSRTYPVGEQARLACILGKRFADNSGPVCHQDPGLGYSLTGQISVPTHHRSANDMHFFFVNGRPIKDRLLSHCVKVAFQDLVPQGRHPIVILYLTLPPLDVDVNVHPCKTEVRFRDPSFVRGFVLMGLRRSLMDQGLKAATLASSRLPGSSDDARAPADGPIESVAQARGTSSLPNRLLSQAQPGILQNPGIFQGPHHAAKPLAFFAPKGINADATLAPLQNPRDEPKQDKGGNLAPDQNDLWLQNSKNGPEPSQVDNSLLPNNGAAKVWPGGFSPGISTSLHLRDPESSSVNFATPPSTQTPNPQLLGPGQLQTWSTQSQPSYSQSSHPQLPQARLLEPESKPIDLGRPLAQLGNSYIVAENGQGLVLIDPHAGHERITYEALKTQWHTSVGTVQPLLTPEPLDLTPQEAAFLAEHQATLTQLGLECIRTQGTWFVMTRPLVFSGHNPAALVLDALALLTATPQGDREDLQAIVLRWRDQIMANWACRQSVRLGQKLSMAEMEALLRKLERTPNSAQCNHGRAVYRQISLRDLARFFDRH